MKLKTRILVGLILLSIFGGTLSAAAQGQAVSWYTKRNTTHTVPVLDGNLRVIEGHKALYCDPRAAAEGKKTVYLTFDAGYENGNVAKVMDVLRDKKVPGAFFVLSHFVRENPELIDRMTKEGHMICNHTARHKDMSRVDENTFAEELRRLEECVEQQTGRKPAPFYRPPEGKFTEENLAWAEKAGYTTVFWSLCYADWDNEKQPAPHKAMEILNNNLHPGAVILLHPTSATNAAILGELIDQWRADGYIFGQLSDILP